MKVAAKRQSTPAPKRVTSGGIEPEAVEKAVKESGGTEGGKVSKVLYVDEAGQSVGEWVSTQMPEDPWGSVTVRGLQEPPFRLEQLVYLAETHPVHSAALEQKTADVCGTGWLWEAPGKDEELDDVQREEISDWFENLAPAEEDMQEVISAVWNDVETTGWGLIEVVRDPTGIARRCYHVPSHTVRAHRDGFRLCQVRGSKKVWFRRWGAQDESGKDVHVDYKTGSLKVVRDEASDLMVIKKKSRRSSWYGIPGYVSCIGYLTLALAARDDNLLFFQNRREPRWAIILWNLSENPTLEADIKRAFTVDLRQPHRNVVIPIEGEGKLDFQQLTGKNTQDGTFDNLAERADKAILISHRIPGERLANSTVGALGGNLAGEVNRVYKEGVVTPSQELFDSRLNKFIAKEYELATNQEPPARIKLDDLDIETDREELDLAVIEFHADMITLGEARKRLKKEPLMTVPKDEMGQPIVGGTPEESPYNHMLYTELPGVSAGASGTEEPGTGGLAGAPVKQSRESQLSVALMHADVKQALVESGRTRSLLQDLADDSSISLSAR